MTLYELTNDYMELLQMAEDPDIDEQAFMDTLESIEGALEVGSRHGQPIVLKIATPAMLTHGHKFYHAQQGIWLTDSIASEYVSIINP